MCLRVAAACSVLGLLVALGVRSSSGQDAKSKADDEFFTKQVKPIFEANCFQCHSHGMKKAKGNLVVDARASLVKGGDSGPAIVPGHPEKSLLIKAISYADEELRMPPKGKLPEPAIAVLREWVRRGAPWPGEKEQTLRRPGPITEEDRAWWAFQPVQRPALPDVKSAEWNDNPIDRFIKARLDKEQLQPAPMAGPRELIRRVYFDLIGLPPTPAEVDEFVAACKPTEGLPWAFERVVDRLLASPRYGERMGRVWLDLVRYAESDGFRLDSYRSGAWRYRDWVIRAFNSDKPYDQFLREQLAGDEINPDDPECVTATGYLCHGIYEYNQRDARTQWNDMLNEVTDVTADAVLALGMGCARCHDHKFDPILQKDYFRLRAFFEPLIFYDDKPLATTKQQAEYRERFAKWEKQAAPVLEQIAKLEAPVKSKLDAEFTAKFPKDIQDMMRKPPAERTPLETQLAALAYRQVLYEFERIDTHVKGEAKAKLIELRKDLHKFDGVKPPDLPLGLTVRDVGPTAPPTLIPKKSNAEPIVPGFLTILDEKPAAITPLSPSGGEGSGVRGPGSTGRRLALANWLTRPEHPLTARVLVNRLWQMHFGRGLVATSSDFGHLGEKPSHPELLDWLAAEFVNPTFSPGSQSRGERRPWSIKHIHRLIITSRTYRQSALHPPAEAALKTDPENRLLWKMPTRRLEAEQIRDAILAVTGKLDLTAGGSGVEPREPRRSIYCKVMRNTRDPLLDAFDWPENFQSTAQRNVTTTPTQSLLMLNSPYMLRQAQDFAARLQREKHSTDDVVINAAIRHAFGRDATADETRIGVEFLKKQAERIQPKKTVVFDTGKMPFREGRAIALTPGGPHPRLHVPDSPMLPKGDFTLEAVVMLRSVFDDGTVRTIAAHWNGDMKKPGWSLGVTSKKSAYKPQVLVLQLWGENAKGKFDYEPVFSSLHVDLNKPYYVAVSVKLDDTGDGGVTFYAKDLGNDEEPLQKDQALHKIVKLPPPTGRFTIGGPDGKLARTWDGLIDDVRLSTGVLREGQLLLTSDRLTNQTVGFWQFEPNPGMLKDSSSHGLHLVRDGAPANATAPQDVRTMALVDFCQVLLNASEFLYVD
jgi:Protein of unknown function (DUF1553)/Protein of unknown function (DUF1549)/Planctomycete cytochrome C